MKLEFKENSHLSNTGTTENIEDGIDLIYNDIQKKCWVFGQAFGGNDNYIGYLDINIEDKTIPCRVEMLADFFTKGARETPEQVALINQAVMNYGNMGVYIEDSNGDKFCRFASIQIDDDELKEKVAQARDLRQQSYISLNRQMWIGNNDID